MAFQPAKILELPSSASTISDKDVCQH